MSVYLIKTTETYRCDTEKEAEMLIESAKNNVTYTTAKHSSELKTMKQKGEVVDEWRRVTITKEFTSEKEPIDQISIKYYNGAFEDDED